MQPVGTKLESQAPVVVPVTAHDQAPAFVRRTPMDVPVIAVLASVPTVAIILPDPLDVKFTARPEIRFEVV